MAINERLVHTASAAAAGTGNQEEGLILHLDANDVDSYDGDGDVWYDIADHEYTPATDVSEHFNTVLYTGTSATNPITGVGFQPDLVWLKQRNSAQNHGLFDSVRGANNFLSSNLTAAAETRTTDTLSSFDPDGFTLTGYTSDVFINYTGRTMVAWCFKAGGAPTASTPYMIDGTGYATLSEAGLADDGDLDLHEASINTKLGFAIYRFDPNNVSGETASFEHGLGTTPELVITKSASNVYNWWTWTNQIDGSWDYLKLNGQDAKANDTFTSGNFADATTMRFPYVFTGVSSNHVAYAFTSKRGVSKVGSYKGTGSGGNKVVTGFEPAWLMVKNISNSGYSWTIFDNKRDTENPNEQQLFPNLDSVEFTTTTNTIDFNRDGFTLKGSQETTNGSGHNYIFLAFAKNTNETSLISDTDLVLHLDAGDFPQKGETNYSNTPTTWEDKTSNSNDATITGANFDSELGNWLDFDGSSAHATPPHAPLDSPSALTMEAWINKDNDSSFYSVLTLRASANNSVKFLLALNTNGTLRLDSANSSSFLTLYGGNTSHKTTIGKWHHVAASIDYVSKDWAVYLDGNKIANGNNTNIRGAGDFNPDRFRIGSNYSSQYFNGQIGQVRVYDTALTDSDISQNFNFTKNNYPNGYNGDFVNMSSSDWDPSGYFDFNGTNQRIKIDSTASTPIDFSKQNYTISAWINPDSVTGNYPIVAKYGTSDSTRAIIFRVQNGVLNLYERGGDNQVTGTSSVAINAWQHVVLVRKPNEVVYYINNVAETISDTNSSATNGGSQRIAIGASEQTTPLYFNGKISDVKIFDKALTSAEVTSEYNKGQFGNN